MSLFSKTHLLLSGLGFLLIGCSSHVGKPNSATSPAEVSTGFDIKRGVQFSPEDWPQTLSADIYVPRGEGPWPGVLLIHGGGWSAGEPSDMEGLAEQLARRGYAVMNTAYRFAPDHVFPAQVVDTQLALKWMAANAVEYRMRPERFGAFGYSAGAHLAAMLGLISEGDELHDPESPKPAAVVSGGTPSDLRKFKGGSIVPTFLGTNWQTSPETYGKASPVTYISAEDPPFFIYHGGSDLLVPRDQADDFHAALREQGVHSELFILRGRGHILAFLTDGPAIAAALDFLDRELR